MTFAIVNKKSLKKPTKTEIALINLYLFSRQFYIYAANLGTVKL